MTNAEAVKVKFLALLNALPLGEEKPELGQSTYNWGKYYLRIFEALADTESAGEELHMDRILFGQSFEKDGKRIDHRSVYITEKDKA